MKRTFPKNRPTSPRSLRTRLAVNFLQALKKIKQQTPPTVMTDKRKRTHLMKTAAYSSMAFSIGPKRAWSRALLTRVKNRTLSRYLSGKIRTNRRPLRVIIQRRRSPSRKGIAGITHEDQLRRVVPGGEGMDFCRLLSETAHYMVTLNAQIQVMESVLDRFSAHE